MKSIIKFALLAVGLLFMGNSLAAQGCTLPVQFAEKSLTQSEQTLLSFVADANRMIFDIESKRYTNTVATLSVFVNGTLVKGVAVKKGNLDTYFALDNLNGKHVEIKGHKASPTDKREVKIFVKKEMSIFNKTEQGLASQTEFTSRIPPSGAIIFASFGACNGKAKLNISVTNDNLSNMVVRVRENRGNGDPISTFTLGGPLRNFVKYIDSDKDLHIEVTNTNPTMRKEIRASVRYTNSSAPTLNANN